MIRIILTIYIYLIIIDAILSYFPQFRLHEWARTLRKITDFTQKPIRKYIPKDWPFDPSPIIVIILLQMLMALW